VNAPDTEAVILVALAITGGLFWYLHRRTSAALPALDTTIFLPTFTDDTGAAIAPFGQTADTYSNRWNVQPPSGSPPADSIARLFAAPGGG
jgi:hypothetical protein